MQYKLCGELIAYSIAHNGTTPAFMSPLLYDMLVTGPSSVTPGPEHITDPELKRHVQTVRIFGDKIIGNYANILSVIFDRKVCIDIFSYSFCICIT